MASTSLGDNADSHFFAERSHRSNQSLPDARLTRVANVKFHNLRFQRNKLDALRELWRRTSAGALVILEL